MFTSLLCHANGRTDVQLEYLMSSKNFHHRVIKPF